MRECAPNPVKLRAASKEFAAQLAAQVVKAWEEAKHPRGKTTDESNAGSFAPSRTHRDPWDMSADELKAEAQRVANLKFDVPEGYVLGFHRTRNNEELASILENGLLIERALGTTYNEPNAVWAYTEERLAKGGPYVVFVVPEKSVERVNDIAFATGSSIPAKDVLFANKFYRVADRGFESNIRHIAEFADMDEGVLEFQHEMFKNAARAAGVIKAWQEEQHPRHPAGAVEGKGGQFAPKDEKSLTDDEMRDLVAKVCEEEEIDPSFVRLRYFDETRTFTLGGTSFNYLGECSDDGLITLYWLGTGKSAAVLGSNLLHEIGHHKLFHVWEVVYEKDRESVWDQYSEEMKRGVSPKDRIVDAEGILRRDHDKHPAYAAMRPYLDDPTGTMRGEFSRTPSEYAQSWWKAMNEGEAKYWQGVHEVFAEAYKHVGQEKRMRARGRTMEPYPVALTAFVDTVERVYERNKP